MKTIFISGVGQRLGLCLAKYFLSSGDKVIGTYRTMRGSISELSELGADLYQVDFYDSTQLHSVITKIKENYSFLCSGWFLGSSIQYQHQNISF